MEKLGNVMLVGNKLNSQNNQMLKKNTKYKPEYPTQNLWFLSLPLNQ